MKTDDGPTSRRRTRRMNLRTTPEERALIERAVEASGTNLTDFVVRSSVVAARRVLADRSRFVLHRDALTAWEKINARPAQSLDGLRRLMQRPSPW